ncbi:MAG: TatD family hydrolase [Rhodothermales bacterium]
MPLLDTHAHVYLDRFTADLDAVVERARAAGVEAVVLPAIDVPSIHAALDLCARYPGYFYAMAALHPSEVKDATDADFEEVRALCDRPEVVAVGESGLDYYWDRSFNPKQHDYLRRHARLAIDTDLPLVLHNRDQKGSEASSRDLVEILTEERDRHPEGERLRGVFHCFGGPAWLAEAALDLGFHVGLGGTLTFKNGGVPEVIDAVPLERVVLETDAPYLSPEPHRGKRNEPAYVRHVAERLAEVKGVPLDEVEAVTTANARTLFRLPGPVA